MLSISLPPDIERFVEEKVAAGRYATAEEVVRSALELLRHRDSSREERIEALRKDIEAGREDFRQGLVYDPHEVLEDLRRLDESLDQA